MLGVIFGEGKNDVCFVGEAFHRGTSGFEEQRFHAEEINSRVLVQEESIAIRRFLRIWRDERAILLKSEEGEDQLMKSVSNFLVELANEDLFFGIVVDLDENPLQARLTELNRQIQNRTQQSVSIEIQRDIGDNGDFRRLRCRALYGSETLDTFGVIAFHDDVEAAAEVDESAPRNHQERTIREYLRDNPEYVRQSVNCFI